ncbi:MAG: SprT family zinc-dependent metalloprotease [Bacteroidia bacterium]|nr:SprT family zinc-dependent metalloprotease [Bacteroidia bacterium]
MADEIKYQIVFSRRRTISLIVSPEKGVTVRAPYRTSFRTIEKFVNEKSGWIRKNLEKHSELIRINHGKLYVDGETHLFMGEEYFLRIKESVKSFVNQYDNYIEIGVDKINDCAKIKMLLERWYRQNAREHFVKKLNEILFRYKDFNFSASKLAVKSLKSRWGSCSSKGRITISSELIKLDERFTEYVIIHELCHLKYHNHGKDYYKLLEDLVPDYKAIRKELRMYITK